MAIIRRTITWSTALGISLVGAAIWGSAAQPAGAEVPDPVQEYVDAAMLAEPGGTQIGPGIVEWDNGAAILTVRDLDGTNLRRAVGSCATGSICVYGSTSLAGARLAFTTCSTFSTAGLGAVVKSMANARNSGYARGYNSAGAILTTLAPTVSLNSAPAGLVKVSCSA